MTRWSTTAPLRGTRGFTLVELMVAITGGLFMSVVVFALARDGSRFYQREARIADATIASVAGFTRVRGDLARAGFMSTPNIKSDPAWCRQTTFKGRLTTLAGIQIQQAAVPDNSELTVAKQTADAITIAGNFTSVDQFPILGAVRSPQSGEVMVYLQQRIGPLARAGYPSLSAAEQDEYLNAMFPKDRVVRVVSALGRTQYSTISSVGNGAQPSVSLSSNVGGIELRENGSECGLRELETGGSINVVNFIRYRLGTLAEAPGYAALAPEDGPPNPWDARRVELLREELDPAVTDADGVLGSAEVVAEYAVGFSIGITVGTPRTGNITALRSFDFDAAEVMGWAGELADDPAGPAPQRVQALRVRLAIRSREPDRDAPIAGETVAAGMYRFPLTLGTQTRYARVRTLQADIALHNQTGLTW